MFKITYFYLFHHLGKLKFARYWSIKQFKYLTWQGVDFYDFAWETRTKGWKSLYLILTLIYKIFIHEKINSEKFKQFSWWACLKFESSISYEVELSEHNKLCYHRNYDLMTIHALICIKLRIRSTIPTRKIIKLIEHLYVKKISFLDVKEKIRKQTKELKSGKWESHLNSILSFVTMTEKKNAKHHSTFFCLQYVNASKFHSLSLKNKLWKHIRKIWFNSSRHLRTALK